MPEHQPQRQGSFIKTNLLRVHPACYAYSMPTYSQPTCPPVHYLQTSNQHLAFIRVVDILVLQLNHSPLILRQNLYSLCSISCSMPSNVSDVCRTDVALGRDSHLKKSLT